VHIWLVNGAVQSGESCAELGSVARRRGPWARWRWDGSRFEATVDRLGHYPLYYVESRGGVAVSESIGELLRLGVRRELDDGAIAAFLRLGFFLGEDTPFRSVRAFPAGGRLSWSTGEGLRVEEERPGCETRDVSRKEAVEGYLERFRHAVAVSLPEEAGSTCLPLSGGRDSRHIAFELHRQQFVPGLVLTQRHAANHPDDDHEVAQEVARELGWPIEVVGRTEAVFDAEREKNRLFDCMTDEHTWFLPGARRIRAAGMRHLLDGIGGDVLSNGLFCREEWVESLAQGRWDEFLHSVKSFGAGDDALQALLAEPYRRRWSWAAARERIRSELSRYMGEENPAHRFFFWNRTRREIAPLMCRHVPGVEVITPYLEPELFDWLWSLPYKVVADRRMHDEAIATAFPQYAHLRYEAKQAPPRPELHGRGLMRGMRRDLGFWRGGEILDRRWLAPRMALSWARPGMADRCLWYAPWAVWLRSLEELAEEGLDGAG
jgi:asparagine synthase (glutamine-hydrolysing)